MSAFTALATRVYKDPITTVYLNSIKQNDDFLIRGCAQAWVVFDGSAATLTSVNNLNISNLTDSGVGRFTLTFTTGFQNTSYAVFGMATRSSEIGGIVLIPSGASPKTTGTLQIITKRALDESFTDFDTTNVIVFGTGN